MSKLKSLFSGRTIFKTNILFIFVFLNIWEFIVARDLFNGMIFGLTMFGPIAFLWRLANLRASMIATFISIFEVTVLSVFVIEGFEFGGASAALKSFYWVPYLGMATVNMVVGLRIYAELRATKDTSALLSASKGLRTKAK